jgi:hypothetical protein
MDGGDSARTEGILAMVGNKDDYKYILNFVSPSGDCVRHPFQDENNNNNPNNFTRDQLLCLMAGLSKSPIGILLNKQILRAYAKRYFRGQNTHDQEGNLKPWYKGRDLFHPGHIGFMIQASKSYVLYPFLPICWAFLLIEILIHTVFTPERESNQLISMLDVSGKFFLKLFVLLNPHWQIHIVEYWSGWRDQAEIGELIIQYILKRTN